MSKRASVVIATYNRGALLQALLQDLAGQTLPASDFEVIVIDDGSTEPVAPTLAVGSFPYELSVETQANAGPAAARHRGIEKARGDVVILLDDDMRVGADFLGEHLKSHARGATVVLGYIAPDPDLEQLPVFERFHAHHLARFAEAVKRGAPVHGIHVCSGNMSLRRADYLALGGFDRALRRSEDRDLGVRLEQEGAKLAFAPDACSVHRSDHDSLDVWLQRAFDYGVYDRRIAQKYPDLELSNPWRFYFMVSPLSRPLLLAAVVAPVLGERLSRGAMVAAMVADERGLQRVALAGTTLCYGLQYFRGLRSDAGSTRVALRDLRAYLGLQRQQRASAPTTRGKTGDRGAFRRFVEAVRADYGSIQRYRGKYHGEVVPLARLPVDLVRKIGFQIAVVVRVMHLSRDLGVPLGPQLTSRIIRHLYGAEIHWNAQIDPGITIVHGVGLVISHAAQVSEGCILFHNVTLGEGVDPETRERGAPRLGRDVHVGPGTTLLGPIEVGAGSKIMAGAVLARSVPPRSLVRPPTPEVRPR